MSYKHRYEVISVHMTAVLYTWNILYSCEAILALPSNEKTPTLVDILIWIGLVWKQIVLVVGTLRGDE